MPIKTAASAVGNTSRPLYQSARPMAPSRPPRPRVRRVRNDSAPVQGGTVITENHPRPPSPEGSAAELFLPGPRAHRIADKTIVKG
jgi:hypothetical protein